jgi:hypothetical protein
MRLKQRVLAFAVPALAPTLTLALTGPGDAENAWANANDGSGPIVVM